MASSRIKPVTLDKVKEYQDAADWFESKPYPLNDQLTIIFEHPTVEKFIDTGIQWLMDLENGVRKVLGDPDEVTLNRAIMNRHQLIVMRRYSHYIKKFVYPNHRDENDNPIEITEPSHLLATAEQLSGNLELVEVATKAVRDYIASNTLTVFGQPLYECGKCKKVAPAADPNYPTIHTVNPIEVFMDLQYRKLSQV